MSKDWPYAKMSHNAAIAGGPDKWIETMNNVAFNNGFAYAKKTRTVPILAIGACLGIGGVIIFQRIHSYFIMKKKQKQLITEKEEINVDTIDEIKPNNTDK